MQYYYSDDNRKGRNIAIAATVLYAVVLTLLLLFVKVTIDYAPTTGGGILVDFGDSETGYGQAQALVTNEPSSSSGSQAEESVMTQDFEDAAAVRQPDTEQNQRPDERTEQNDAQVQEREVNRRALFPGSGQTAESASQGSAEGEGNQGREFGAEGGNPQGTGTGSSGISYDLTGRRPVGSLVPPVYPRSNTQGIVVIEVAVDANGNVTTASYRPRGSTTQDRELINAAMTAARNTKFTPDENNPVQTGTITYIFRLTQ